MSDITIIVKWSERRLFFLQRTLHHCTTSRKQNRIKLEEKQKRTTIQIVIYGVKRQIEEQRDICSLHFSSANV